MLRGPGWGFTEAEVRAYAPEHRPIVRLQPVAVPPQRWYGFNGPPMLWMHPWQYEHVRDEYPWLAPNGPEILASPLMSLRTLALTRNRFNHVKTAVDIQMTSAVRTVSAASVHNGHTLSRLMVSLAGRAPALSVLPDVSGGAVIVAGEPDRRLAVVHRRGPLLAEGELAYHSRRSRRRHRPQVRRSSPNWSTPATAATRSRWSKAWRKSCYHRATAVSTRHRPRGARAERARRRPLHPADPTATPNGRFTRLLYRDFGGVRVSAARLRQHGIEPPPLHGDVPDDDPEVLRTKVFASAISTVLGEVVTVLARSTGMDHDKAWQRVAAVARGVTGPDTTAVFAPTLPLKATTAMRLADDAVADIWTRQPNPLAGLQ